jgi:hypothetical protein
MKEMCEKLKAFPKEGNNNRTDILKEYVFTINNMILNYRDEVNDSDCLSKCFYKGILLPFDDNKYTSDEYNSIVIIKIYS